MADIHDALIGASVWPADLVTAGIVSAATQVYDGRRQQGATQSVIEVWLEQEPVIDESPTGFQEVEVHPYLVHVLVSDPMNHGGDKTGKVKLRTLQSHLRTIKSRYRAARPFSGDIPAIVTCFADDEDIDVDTENKKTIEGTVRVSFVVHG